jgi:aromatic-L-amino-acid decarboxylase
MKAISCVQDEFSQKLGSPLNEPTLDPEDWTEIRTLGHQMLDEMFDYLKEIRQRPVWQPIPDGVRDQFRSALPTGPTDAACVYRDFAKFILPYSIGNTHPGFMGWVHGGGTAVGMLAEMLAGGLNANLGGRDHIPIEVERQITEWMRQLFGFPEGSSGLFVTGSSLATFIAVQVARNRAQANSATTEGAATSHNHLVAYASHAAHGCIARALEMSGLGKGALRRIPVNVKHQMRIAELRRSIVADRNAGLTPFFMVGTAGTVDIGAFDELDDLADLAAAEDLWFHVDGAMGALAILAPSLAPKLIGIERADSIAFDFHKWAQVPYDAGFVLVRDGKRHLETFSSPAAYLRRESRGAAAGSPWPCHFGPDLSRGFRALKTWFTLKVYGTEQLGAVMSRTCELAQLLKHLVELAPDLELAAPVQLNIVCFRYRCSNSDAVNAQIVVELSESGIAVASTTVIDGHLAIRAAIFNHRTQACDLEALVAAVTRFGKRIVAQ